MSSPFTSTITIYKQPSETLNLGMDFSTWLISTDTLSSPVVTSEEVGGGTSDLAIIDVAVSTQQINFTVASGSVGRYRVETTVIVSDGQSLEADGILVIIDK